MKIQDRIKMKTKSNKGITLIALVITIIVLLILAGVTIAALSGDNGILKRATEAKEQTNQKNDEETEKLAGYESTIDQYANGATGGSGNGGQGGSGGGTGTNFTNVNAADSNPAGVVPENSTVVEADASKGIVIKDKNNNEWVWIEVPKTTVFTGLTIDTTGTLTEQNYTDIKNKLIAYAGVYRKGAATQSCNWADEWYAEEGYTLLTGSTSNLTEVQKALTNGCGLTYDEYKAVYQKMLKSVYTYGGFWIGRYEAGIEGSINDLNKARTRSSDRITIGTSPKAISQKDAIPYNYVCCSEAQALAKEMTPNSNYTSSLMFGIQWDLVCKYLEIKGGLSVADINSNSTSWGNYENAKIENVKSGKYAILDTNTGNLGIWNKIVETYTKPNTSPDNYTLLSTGVTDYTKKMNIYDFAGNEREWTLENTFGIEYPCVSRGGLYYYTGSDYPASSRNSNSNSTTTGSLDDIGFRCALYK